jgi:hypothetical protein
MHRAQRLLWTVLAILLASTIVPFAGAAEMNGDFYVAPDGDDANPGTKAKPFATIQKAADAMKAGDTCFVRAGTYAETVRPARSGKPDAPIVFRNWPGERPKIVGTDAVTGWTREEGDVWAAKLGWDLGKFNQVFIDGKAGFEARWPSKKNDDPLDWEGVRFSRRSRNGLLHCDHLPPRPADAWKGGVLWVMAGVRWTSWSAVITGSDGKSKTLRFDMPTWPGTRLEITMGLGHRRGGTFYVTGLRADLNAPGEWLVDAKAGTLLICVKPGADPNKMSVRAKRRLKAFDLDGREHVQIIGFDVQGATITLVDAAHCLVKDIRATWISHIRGGDTGYGLREELGIVVSGHHNTIRDSEIAYSAGNGIRLRGYRHAVVNCHIHHTDFTGCYDAPIKMHGWEMLISHNTIHDTGRDCIQPGGQAHVIQYNRIYRMGRIAEDLGASYVCASDGGGTEFHHNWVHDNLAPQGHAMGIYLDNFSTDYFVYRNVIWNIPRHNITLNKPCMRNVVVNNTMLGDSGSWGRWRTDWMYACVYANNATCRGLPSHPQIRAVNNRTRISAKRLNARTFRAFRSEKPGRAVPGLAGDKPGIGAYDESDPDWRAGHDFENPPNPVYKLADTPLRNVVKHGSFDWAQWRGELGPWKPTGAGAAKSVLGNPNGIVHSYTKRDSIIGSALELSGEAEAGVEQAVDGLRPKQVYEVSAWVKMTGDASVEIGVRDGETVLARANADRPTRWHLLTARFTTSDKPGSLVVFVTKSGAGTAFVDHVSMSGVIDGIEPVKPGYAP